MTTTVDLAKLLEQRAKLEKAIAAAELPALQGARDALTDPAVDQLLIELAGAQLKIGSGSASVQIGNVITVIQSVRVVLADEISRANAAAGLNETATAPAVG